MLESALADSTPLTLVLGNALTVCITGMHPHLHPALRPPWWVRAQVLHALQMQVGSSGLRPALVEGAAITKEAVRRMLASTVAAVPALHAGLSHLGHPVGLLTTPPLRLPNRGMEGAMEAFVAVGESVLTLDTATTSFSALLRATFAKHTLEGSERPAGSIMGWDPPYLGMRCVRHPVRATRQLFPNHRRLRRIRR